MTHEMKSNGLTGIVGALASALAGKKDEEGRPTHTLTRLLVLLIVAAAVWWMDAKTERKVLHETVDEVRHAATSHIPKPIHKRHGTGAVSVSKSTDLSKPGGGVISEDDSWKEELASAAPRPKEKAVAEKAGNHGEARHVDFTTFRDGQWVTGVGTVTRVLEDDTIPPRHQRFILADELGNTVLVAHNIDQASRVFDLSAGDVIAFHGEYRVNDRGGVIHWTHPDSSGRRKGGWLQKR